MRTVITHFYNEEYLLPWWLEHHKKYFDHGILIDYASTDRSVEICRDICPTWQLFPSGNQYFDARQADYEVEFYERQIQGWRMALTVTEFVVGDLDKMLMDTNERKQYLIPGIRFTAWDLDNSLDQARPLWEQLHMGVDYITNPIAHQCRSLHNFNDIKYPVGRHFLPHNTTDALVFHYAHCIVGEPMLKRRLQVQHRISPNDRAEGLGTHHYYGQNGNMTVESLHDIHMNFIVDGVSDCSELIKSATKFS